MNCNVITASLMEEFHLIRCQAVLTKQSSVVWGPMRKLFVLTFGGKAEEGQTRANAVWSVVVKGQAYKEADKPILSLRSITCMVPSGISDSSTLQKGGAQLGWQWHLFSWLQTCETELSHIMLSWLCRAPKCCKVYEFLTPWLLHLTEQLSVPYTFKFLMSWHLWL